MSGQRMQANDLMERAVAGEAGAFEGLAQLTAESIHRFCLAHLPRHVRPAAEDARQECYLRAWRARRKYRSGRNATAWLMGIAMNVVREIRRKRLPASGMDGLDLPARPEDPPDERLALLAPAVEQLPARQREAIICRFLQGMSVAETAHVMGCAEGTVKATVFKAISALGKSLGEQA